jgi:YbbR domain-containing protein
MIGSAKKQKKFYLNEDTSYKIVAFFVTLVLWVTILGRKSSVVVKDLNLEVLVKSSYVVGNDLRKKVRVQLSGPRMVLKKYAQTDQPFTVDLWDAEPGKHRIRLGPGGLNLPVGLKLLSVSPGEIMVVVRDAGKKVEGK